MAEGATAIDVLETLPSIQIDDDGGIGMPGSGHVLIYINGRPINLSADDAESVLAQFPANSVKDIELITNPSTHRFVVYITDPFLPKRELSNGKRR